MPEDRYVLKVVEAAAELEQYFAVRAAIFVDEQGIFGESDRDKYDAVAIPIAAQDRITGRIVGTVRCYQTGNDTWVGGRLAVLPEFRGTLGPALVQKAVEEVCIKGGRQLVAYVQLQNVRFFQRLGWRRTGEIVYCGKPHIVMEANLTSRLPQGRAASKLAGNS